MGKMSADELLKAVQSLSAEEIGLLIEKRRAEDKALAVLYRAAIARQREENEQRRHREVD